jgi:hypothetical protein
MNNNFDTKNKIKRTEAGARPAQTFPFGKPVARHEALTLAFAAGRISRGWVDSVMVSVMVSVVVSVVVGTVPGALFYYSSMGDSTCNSRAYMQ